MKIGIVVLFVNSFGKKGLYNSQEIGIAKELVKNGHFVTIYKCISKNEKKQSEILANNLIYKCIPVTTIGNNTITTFSFLDSDLDKIFCFTDIQLITKQLYRWSRRANVTMIPYVGITESTSGSKWVRTLMNKNAKSLFKLYNRIGVFAKTNAVRKNLEESGVKKVQLAPVGIDFELMNADYAKTNIFELKDLLGLERGKKYVLLIGRIESDRNPLDCVTVFEKLFQKNQCYRLLVIGKGTLKENLRIELEKKKLLNKTKFIAQVPNNEMWKYYRIADRLISFSKTEIFGMSILEAMYYECPVFVVRAPGPNDIIENNVNGFLFASADEMAEKIVNIKCSNIGYNAHEHVVNEFSWGKTVKLIEKT